MFALARRAGLRLLTLALLAASPAALADDVATFDALLRLVRAEPDPAAVLEQCGDTVYTLSAAQRSQLAKAGAPATLIDAFQKKRMGLDDVQNFGLIVDCSGSMKETLPDGRTKMDAAKAVLSELVDKIPDGLNVSLTLYGHDLAAKCRAVEVKRPLGPIGPADRQALSKVIAELEPIGHTPIAAALRAAATTLSGAKGLSQVVLVTDGMETCHEDPAEVAEAVTLRHQLRRVEVVGLGIKKDEKGAVSRIARRGRGKFYDAQTAEQLAPALTKVVRVEPQPESRPQEPDPTEMTAVQRALAEQLKDEDPVVRREAAEALGKMGRKARPAAQALVDRIADDLWAESAIVEAFKQTAFDNQSHGSKDAALGALKQIRPDRLEEALLAAAKSKNRGVKTWAIKRLGELPRKASDRPDGGLPPATRALVEQLKAGDPSARGAAALALGNAKLGDAEMEPVVQALAEQLKDEDPVVRREAAEALGKMGRKARPAAQALVDRIADDLWVESAIVEAFKQTAFDNQSHGSKDAALGALKQIRPDRLEEALLAAAKSKNRGVKTWAIKRLGELAK